MKKIITVVAIILLLIIILGPDDNTNNNLTTHDDKNTSVKETTNKTKEDEKNTNTIEIANSAYKILDPIYPYGCKITVLELINDGDGFNTYYGRIKIEDESKNKENHTISIRVEDNTNAIQSIVLDSEIKIYEN